jgi:hypothetical protein
MRASEVSASRSDGVGWATQQSDRWSCASRAMAHAGFSSATSPRR